LLIGKDASIKKIFPVSTSKWANRSDAFNIFVGDMSKDIGEQFAMMNEVSAKISQKTFDKFVEEAVTEFKQDHDTDKVNGLQVLII